MPGVTTLVPGGPAPADDLTPTDYRDIYDELRSKCSLRQFVDTLSSAYSIAFWSKYERDPEADLPREAKQELRRAVGVAPLPLTIGESVALAGPLATVYLVGDAPADRIVMVGADVHQPILLRLNGRLDILDDNPTGDPPAEYRVTELHRPQRRAARKSIGLSPANWERLSALRHEANMTWDELAAWVAQLCGV